MSGSPLGDGEIDDSTLRATGNGEELDRTVRSARDRAEPDPAARDGAAPDEATAVSERRSAADPDAPTIPVSSVEPDAAPGPRRTGSEEAAADTDEGSTMVVRRESRRRAERGIHDGPPGAADTAVDAAAEPGAPVERIAYSPEPDVPVYAPRGPQPARIARVPHAQREPQAPVDTLAAEAIARARRRRRALLVAVAVSVVLVVAVAALVVLTTMG